LHIEHVVSCATIRTCLSEKDTRIAKAGRERPVPPLEQIRVLAVMPHATEIDRRNRALIAFTLTTGVRTSSPRPLRHGFSRWAMTFVPFSRSGLPI
jgi:hypothetical protein